MTRSDSPAPAEPDKPGNPDNPGNPAIHGELFPGLEEDTRRNLGALLPLIEKTFPIPTRFRRNLAADVAELSRLLTSARGERPLSYLNRPPLLSAYLRYFLPWNLYRLCRLIPGLDLPLAPGDAIIDLGSGPLSFPIGLWLCRRDLRSLPLKFRCLDRSKAALEAGKRLFTALIPPGTDSPWTIQTIHGDLGREFLSEAGGRNRPAGDGAALITALNLYNEPFQSISPGDDTGQRRFAQSQATLLAGMAAPGGRLLIVEPGTPPSGRLITLLREALIGLDRPPLSPCTHSCPCPFPGRKQGASKWCHFAFDTEEAPAALHRLSAAAGIPKERATLSFLLAGPQCRGTAKTEQNAQTDQTKTGQSKQTMQTVRVISSPFPAGRGPDSRAWGRYVCGEKGMALLRDEKPRIESLESGTLLTVRFTGELDPKSGGAVCTAVPAVYDVLAGIKGLAEQDRPPKCGWSEPWEAQPT
jgi:hypothetical protein